jgi:hypothetical protein
MTIKSWTGNNWTGNRRNLLKVGTVGVSAIGLSRLVSACGGSSSGNPLDGPISKDMAVVQRWVPDQLGPGSVRLPVSLADNAGLLMKGPATLNAKVVNYLDNTVVEEGLVAERFWLGEGTTPFWVFQTDVQDVAMYSLIVEGGPTDGAAFQIRDPKELDVVHAGDSLPTLETPTISDHRGVEPYCTRVPAPCPFHEVSLVDALATGKRVVFLVGTPAHCRTAVCAPVLDGLIEVANDFSDVIFIHADVYADETATTTAPVVDTMNLTFEPVLWVTDASGVITHRFEGVWHPDEVRQVLA